jgi:glycerophosphoryl diester phosphodiesterase
MAMISAHRGGAGDIRSSENTVEAFEAAIALGCDYVELDVRLTADGTALVAHRDQLESADGPASIAAHRLDELSGTPLVTLEAVLELVRGRIKAHIDLKVRGRETEVVARIVETLGVDSVVITTAEDSSVRELVAWSREHAPGLLVGLSSSPRSSRGRWDRQLARVQAAFPRTRIRRSHATVVASHKTLALLTLRRYARRRGLPLLVWTVDDPGELERWMNDPSTWMVTTNHPARAIAARRTEVPGR